MPSGNGFVVEGDLIDGLQFTARFAASRVTMGQTLPVDYPAAKAPVQLTIKFKSQASNNHGDAVAVDHIDL